MRYRLPLRYGKTRLVLLPVDPYQIHAYWEVAPEMLDQVKRAMLRFYRSKPQDFFDVEIDVRAHNWYVHLSRPEKSLYAELVLKRDDGSFTSTVRSRVIHMPRAQPKMSSEQHFMKLEPTDRRVEITPPPPPRPAAMPINAAEIVRESLRNAYASRRWPPEQVEHESVHRLSIPGPAPGRRILDLTAMAEIKFRARGSPGASDIKK